MMSWHHIWSVAGAAISTRTHTISISIRIWSAAHRREAAAEACGAALEVAETAAWASPIPRTRTVLRWGKRSEKRWSARWLRASSTIEDLKHSQSNSDFNVSYGSTLTRAELGATSMARSFSARPFMLSDSAACYRRQSDKVR